MSELKILQLFFIFFIKNLTGTLAYVCVHTQCNRNTLFLLCKTAELLELD